jgi:hypothetical protein
MSGCSNMNLVQVKGEICRAGTFSNLLLYSGEVFCNW